jgi:hypothetical protein
MELLLPTTLRRRNQKAFLTAVIAPLNSLYRDTLYKMQHTCQVIYLEKMLNEHYTVVGYDPTNHEATKLIYIEDAPRPPYKYIYLQEEIEFQGKPYLYLNSGVGNPNTDLINNVTDEFGDEVPNWFTSGGIVYLTGDTIYNDFVVYVPINLTFDEIKMRALIDYYKLAGKKYTIEID